VRCRLDVGGRNLTDAGYGSQDHVELSGENVQFFLGHCQSGQPGEMGDLGAADSRGRGVYGVVRHGLEV
jgi:hypothetical protein